MKFIKDYIYFRKSLQAIPGFPFYLGPADPLPGHLIDKKEPTMGKVNCRRVSPGNLEWADLASGDPIYIINTSKYYNKVETYVNKFGGVSEKGKILKAPAVRSLLNMYRGATDDGDRSARLKYNADRVAEVDALFTKLMALEGIGVGTATLICIAMQDRLPDLKHIYAAQVHKELFVEYESSSAPKGRTGYQNTEEISSVITAERARKVALAMAGSVLDSLDLKGKPSKEEVAGLATTVGCTYDATRTYVMDTKLYEAETELLSMFTEEVETLKNIPSPDEYSEAGMSEDQFEAFKGIISCNRRVMCLQGCPGSGKSHLITALDRFYKKNYGERPLITSFMNKACLNLFQRLPDYRFEQLYREACIPTICSLYYKLKSMPEPDFHTPMIIVDESSVLSSKLLSMLLYIHSCSPDARILFVGDKNQLPRVCAYGTPFHNMMRRPDVAKFTLSTFHRSNGQGIYELMKKLTENGSVAISRDTEGGVFTHKVETVDQACNLAKMMAIRIVSRGQDIKDFGVIAETNELVRRLNIAMASGHMGADEDSLSYRTIKDKKILVPDRVGMRVMANDTVHKGDKHISDLVGKNEFGTIAEYSDKHVVVTMDIGARDIVIDDAEKFHSVFGPGYASTVHKFQGSEADEIMYVLENSANLHGNGFCANKELKYVGLTRAKKKLDILAIEYGISGGLASSAVELSTRPLANALMCF